jgi:tRNA(Met) cytidine acetyltransferase
MAVNDSNNNCQTYYQALQEQARLSGQRRLLVISGEQQWVLEQAKACVEGRDVVWVGDEASVNYQTLSVQQCQKRLGSECQQLVYDAHAGFNANALSAISGTLVAGGVMILLVPPLAHWASYDDPDYQRFLTYPYQSSEMSSYFLQRLSVMLQASSTISLVEQEQALPSLPVITSIFNASPELADKRCRTVDQQEAVKAINHVVTGHRRRPLVLRADRGRGKSSALGIAAGELLLRDKFFIVVTAPQLSSVTAVLEHAAHQNDQCMLSSNSVKLADSELKFIPPDELLRENVDCDLLLIDEAAAIPVAVLTALLNRYSRTVFSTTVHGYEGSGRGFDLRFKQVLDSQTPQWRSMDLAAPIRWQEGDPLEQWLFDVMLLNATTHHVTGLDFLVPGSCQFGEVTRDQLVSDEALLQNIFSLLVLAHYQTTPNDLRFLLDSPNLRIWCMYQQQTVVAVVLAVEEGEFDTAMAAEVYQARRRPQGHLIAQSLSVHGGFEKAPQLKGLRIMRIAVQPALQRRGVGSAFLRQLQQAIETDGYDWLGASFGATAETLSFWQKAALSVVRLGVARDASSGTHSVIVLQGLSVEGSKLVDTMTDRFQQQLPLLLIDLFSDLEPTLIRQLFAGFNVSESFLLDEHDRKLLESFSEGKRQFENCYVALRQLVLEALSSNNFSKLESQQSSLVIMKLLQGKSWAEIVQALGYSGKKQMVAALAELTKELLQITLKK